MASSTMDQLNLVVVSLLTPDAEIADEFNEEDGINPEENATDNTIPLSHSFTESSVIV